MLSAFVILSLCIGSLLAEDPIVCKSKKISPELRKYIVDYHNRYRESNRISWDCDLEKKAQFSVRGDSIDKSKITNYNVNEFTDEVKKGQDAKEYLVKALRRWYWKDEAAKSHANMASAKKVGCSYRSGTSFNFVCVYNTATD